MTEDTKDPKLPNHDTVEDRIDYWLEKYAPALAPSHESLLREAVAQLKTLRALAGEAREQAEEEKADAEKAAELRKGDDVHACGHDACPNNPFCACRKICTGVICNACRLYKPCSMCGTPRCGGCAEDGCSWCVQSCKCTVDGCLVDAEQALSKDVSEAIEEAAKQFHEGNSPPAIQGFNFTWVNPGLQVPTGVQLIQNSVANVVDHLRQHPKEPLSEEAYEQLRNAIEEKTNVILVNDLLRHVFLLEQELGKARERHALLFDDFRKTHKPVPEQEPEDREYLPKRAKDRNNKVTGRTAIPVKEVIPTYLKEMGFEEGSPEADFAICFYSWLREG